MSSRALPWRSPIAHRLTAEIKVSREETLFNATLVVHPLSDGQLANLEQLWHGGRLPKESLVQFMFRQGWFVPAAKTVLTSENNETMIRPILTDEGLAVIRQRVS